MWERTRALAKPASTASAQARISPAGLTLPNSSSSIVTSIPRRWSCAVGSVRISPSRAAISSRTRAWMPSRWVRRWCSWPDRITSTVVSLIDISRLMPVDLELSPKQKRANGAPCCEPVVYPDVQREEALRMAEVAKALGDPIRLQLVDVLRKHAGKVCVCELVPLFDISQSTLSHHLGKLRAAGIVDSERKGLWAYYYVIPDALKELSAWLS